MSHKESTTSKAAICGYCSTKIKVGDYTYWGGKFFCNEECQEKFIDETCNDL